MLYVVGAVAVPVALLCGTLLLERLEQRVLGAPVPTDGAALPEAHRPRAAEPAAPAGRAAVDDAAAA